MLHASFQLWRLYGAVLVVDNFCFDCMAQICFRFLEHISAAHVNPFFFFSGRGVFTQEYIEAKSFVVEYRGVLCQSKGINDKNNNYLFDFKWNGQRYW